MYIYDYWENKQFFDVYDFGSADPLNQNLNYPVGWNTSSQAFASMEKDSPPWHTVSVRGRNKAHSSADLWKGYKPNDSLFDYFSLKDLNVRFCDGPSDTNVLDVLQNPSQYTWEGVNDPSSPGDDNYNVWMSNLPVAWPITETEVVVRASAFLDLLNQKREDDASGDPLYSWRELTVPVNGSQQKFRKLRFMNEVGNSFEVEIDFPTLTVLASELPCFDFVTPQSGFIQGGLVTFPGAGSVNWADYFLGINEFEGRKRIFGDMLVLSLKPGSPTFTEMGIPIVKKIGDLFSLPEDKLFPAWTLDSQGRVIIQYVSTMPETNNPFGDDVSDLADYTRRIYTYYWPMKEEFTGDTDETGLVVNRNTTEYDIDCNMFYYGLSNYIAPMRCKANTSGHLSKGWHLGDSGSPSWVKTTDHGWVFIGTWKGGMHNAYIQDQTQSGPVVDGGYCKYLKKNPTPFDEINFIWGSQLQYVDLSNTVDYYVDNRLFGNDQITIQNPYESISCSVEKLYGEDTQEFEALAANGSPIVGVCADINYWYDGRELNGDALSFPAAELDKRGSAGIISVGKGYCNTPYGSDTGPDFDENGQLLTNTVEVIAPYSDYLRGTAYGDSPIQNRDLYSNGTFVQWQTNISFPFKLFTRDSVVPIPPHKRIIKVVFDRPSLLDGAGKEMIYPEFNITNGDEYLLGVLNMSGSDFLPGYDSCPYLVQTVSYTTVNSETNSVARWNTFGNYKTDPSTYDDLDSSNYKSNLMIMSEGNYTFNSDYQYQHGPVGCGGILENTDPGRKIKELGFDVPLSGIDSDAVKDPFVSNRSVCATISKKFIDSFQPTVSIGENQAKNNLNFRRNSVFTWNDFAATDLLDFSVDGQNAVVLGNFVSTEILQESPLISSVRVMTRLGQAKMANIWNNIPSGLYESIGSDPAITIGELGDINRFGTLGQSWTGQRYSSVIDDPVSNDINFAYAFEDASFTVVPWYFPYIKLLSGSPNVYEQVYINGDINGDGVQDEPNENIGPFGKAGDKLILRVETVSKDSGYRKDYKIADYGQFSQPEGQNYELIFTNTSDVVLATYRSTIPGSVLIPADDIGDGILRVTLSPIDGEEDQWVPDLSLQRTYKTGNDFDFDVFVFQPIVIEGPLADSITFESSSSTTANRVDMNVSSAVGQSFDMMVSCNYPHDSVALGDKITVNIQIS